jgi:urease accessory protein
MTATCRTARPLACCVAAGVGAVLLTATPAAAHVGTPIGGAVDGLLHPVTGPDHLLAMLAVGVVAALTMPLRRAWTVPVAFLTGMIAGGAAGLVGAPLPGAEALIMASVFVLGVTIAAAVVVEGGGGWLVAALVVAGFAHGHAHGAEAPDSAHPLAYVGGFLLATASLHALGLGVGTAIRQRRTMQVGVGAATVAAGALLLA